LAFSKNIKFADKSGNSDSHFDSASDRDFRFRKLPFSKNINFADITGNSDSTFDSASGQDFRVPKLARIGGVSNPHSQANFQIQLKSSTDHRFSF
jgi:hypothetical protein